MTNASCGEHDSIDHTFIDCEVVKNFVKNVIDWFNAVNNSNFTPTMDEKLLSCPAHMIKHY